MNIVIPASTLKNLISFSVSTICSQIDILEELGYHQTRRSFIERIRLQSKYLLELVESVENHNVEHIQNSMNEIIDATAMLRKMANEESARTCDTEWRRIAALTAEKHNETVKSMGKIEMIAMEKLSEEFAVIKKDITNLANRIERLRI